MKRSQVLLSGLSIIFCIVAVLSYLDAFSFELESTIEVGGTNNPTIGSNYLDPEELGIEGTYLLVDTRGMTGNENNVNVDNQCIAGGQIVDHLNVFQEFALRDVIRIDVSWDGTGTTNHFKHVIVSEEELEGSAYFYSETNVEG